jgi:voltage-gated potassium channel
MLLNNQMVRGSLALAALFVAGVLGYRLIEGWSLLDAAYMTVVTFTTVGYDEVRPLSNEGRIFNIFLMVGGVGVMLYILTRVVRTVVEEEVLKSFVRRRRMKTRLAGLNKHFILCGFGRVGREVALDFQKEGVRFIVIDSSPKAIAEVDELGFPYLQGEASQDDTLISAGIARARGLVAALGSDSDNVFVALSARGLNPDVTIVARATDRESEDKLRRAGADRVVSPFAIGGHRMALSATRPLAADFLHRLIGADPDGGLRLAEVLADDDSPLVGSTIEESFLKRGVQVLALMRPQEDVVLSPKANVFVQPGDGLVLVGTPSQLEPIEGRVEEE